MFIYFLYFIKKSIISGLDVTARKRKMRGKANNKQRDRDKSRASAKMDKVNKELKRQCQRICAISK